MKKVDRNTADAPATRLLLIKDASGELRELRWNYYSAIGMLNYLSGSMCPNLAMVMHQVASFSINPK